MPRLYNSKIEIRLKEGTPALDISDKVRDLYMKESLFVGHTEWEMQIAAESMVSEEILLFNQGEFQIRLSTSLDEFDLFSIWRDVVLESSHLVYEGNIPLVVLRGADLVTRFKRNHLWRAFVDKPALSVFVTVAANNGLIPLIDVEGIGTWYQLGQTDWDLLKQIQAESSTRGGQRNSWMIVDNRILKVLPIDYARPALRSLDIGGGDDRVNHITFFNYGKEAEYKGASTLRTSGFDVRNKRYLEFTPLDTALPLLAGKLINPFGSTTRYQTTPFIRFDTVVNTATTDWVEVAVKSFGCHIKMEPDLALKPGDIIEIGAEDALGNRSSFGGRYPIYEVAHQYTALNAYEQAMDSESAILGVTTHLACYRRSFGFGNSESSATSISDIQSSEAFNVISSVSSLRSTVIEAITLQ